MTKTVFAIGVAVLVGIFCAMPASAQQGGSKGAPAGRSMMNSRPATLNSTLDVELTIIEHEFEGAAEAMPEDKYSFAPTNGNFSGVRTFALEVKHVATANNRFFNAVLGKPDATSADELEAENGPDSIATKEQIMQYLKDSFALGHKAIAQINADNAFAPLKTPLNPFLRTRTVIVIFACSHAMDHYGQMVEYLRDNGIVPPASRQRPPANPAKR